ncbi:hypothetical protein [Desulfoplanes formicivorans]|nr:hypothetical protein [Desulfoplanes formicivorans]
MAMYRDEIEAYKEAMCQDAASSTDSNQPSPPDKPLDTPETN